MEEMFPISRDPPEGGTSYWISLKDPARKFPISRDPPEGGTGTGNSSWKPATICFQFLGIPPKGELSRPGQYKTGDAFPSFQFLGIPPKGELLEG